MILTAAKILCQEKFTYTLHGVTVSLHGTLKLHMKIQAVKVTDQIAGRENARLVIAGHKNARCAKVTNR